MNRSNTHAMIWILVGLVILLTTALLMLWNDRSHDGVQPSSHQISAIDSGFETSIDSRDKIINAQSIEQDSQTIDGAGLMKQEYDGECINAEDVQALLSQHVPTKISAALDKLGRIELMKNRSDASEYSVYLMKKMDLDENELLTYDELTPQSPILEALGFNTPTRNPFLGEDGIEQTEFSVRPEVFLSVVDIEYATLFYFDESDIDGNGLLEGEEFETIKRFLFPLETELIRIFDRIR
jgi:hypothetical protein